MPALVRVFRRRMTSGQDARVPSLRRSASFGPGEYVSANGIEDFRQKTPKNSVEIAKLLLDAGAEVNAESDAYGGRPTTLRLTATSCHPEAAGLSIPLMELLISRGAPIEAKDESFDGTPLEWALYAWGNASERAARGDYYEVVALLVRADATLKSQWLEVNDEHRRRAVRKLRSDPRMLAALRGEMPR